MDKIFDALQVKPTYVRRPVPYRHMTAPVFEESCLAGMTPGVAYEYYLGFEFWQKTLIPNNDKQFLDQAKYLFKRNLHNMAYGNLINEIHKLETELMYKYCDNTMADRFKKIYSIIEGEKR